MCIVKTCDREAGAPGGFCATCWSLVPPLLQQSVVAKVDGQASPLDLVLGDYAAHVVDVREAQW